jgi:collagenase-like PrtC family protease
MSSITGLRLSVPTNFSPELLQCFKGLPVEDIYGALTTTPIGSGRPPRVLPQVSEAQAREHVKLTHEKSIQFNYVINAPCMGGVEYQKEAYARIIDHLAWIDSIGADSVTVSIPYLLGIVKYRFPRLRAKISVIAQVNSVQTAKFYEDLGADEINIDYMANRDFETLEALRKAVRCDLTLLVNDVCLFGCPFRQSHYNLLGHASQDQSSNKGDYPDYNWVSCLTKMLSQPAELIRSRWIRPEDLTYYEQIGISKFKLSGRNMPTTWIGRAASAYANRRYDGNLGDILVGSTIAPQTKLPRFRIDNHQLDGFLDYFRGRRCSTACNTCNYCESVAKRAASIPEPEASARCVTTYKQLLHTLVSSSTIQESR